MVIDRENSIIHVEGLTKIFGRFTAVNDLHFAVKRGEIFGFLGPNGAGKSTTIRMLCGLISSTSGTATVNGFDINRHPEQVRQSLGYMSQKFSLYKDLSIAQNIAFFGGVYGLDPALLLRRTEDFMVSAGLKGFEHQLTGTLSGALQQRLALGCAILHQPPVLFLDEPTSGVDPISRRFFWDRIHELAGQGVTILITTHFMDEAEYCDRIGFINNGQLVALDTPQAIKTHAVGEDLFELALPSLSKAPEKLQAIDGIVSTSFFGSRLHLFCRPGFFSKDLLAAAIRGIGLAVQSLEPVPVTLEDAFIRLAQKGTNVLEKP